MKTIKKILIANRGEIAVRIARTAKTMDIRTVGVYTEYDTDSLHIKKTDEVCSLGASGLKDTYLNQDKLVKIALQTDCDAIHPGYGFLSESYQFVDICREAGLIFIGPSADVIRLMGNKEESVKYVKSIGIPVLEHTKVIKGDIYTSSNTPEYPLLVKATAGGGGKGIQVVHDPGQLNEAIRATGREALAYFGDERVFIENLLEHPRHIEVQILGDNYGNIIHLFERECSLQRHFQKIVEESPASSLNDDLRKNIVEAAVHIGKSVGYSGAGTIEFLLDNNRRFYFLEMNTRIQVEHVVTEMATGVDIVMEQILIASGRKLSLKQDMIRLNNHAIEARIYAENPESGFLPSPGKITYYCQPSLDKIRFESGIETGCEISEQFDPMIAKIIAKGKTRKDAVRNLSAGLSRTVIHGINNNISFLLNLLNNKDYIANNISTGFIEENLMSLISSDRIRSEARIVFLVTAGILVASSKPSVHASDWQSVWQRIGFWRHLLTVPIILEGNIYIIEPVKKDQHFFNIQINNNTYEAEVIILNNNRLKFILNENIYNTFFSFAGRENIWITYRNQTCCLKRKDKPEPDLENNISNSEHEKVKIVVSPIHGRIAAICVNEEDEVHMNDTILIIDSMKIENKILSPVSGKIVRIYVKEGEQVNSEKLLVELE